MKPDPYSPAYRKALWLFEQRHFFECHEMLEPEWLQAVGREKTFYQMLIQAAVAFVHWERGNRSGVLALEHSFQQKAESLGESHYLGLDIAQLRYEMNALIEPLRQNPSAPLPALDQIQSPRLRLQGVEGLECSAHELLILSRQNDEKQTLP